MFMFPFSLPAAAAELAALDEETVDTVRPSPATTYTSFQANIYSLIVIYDSLHQNDIIIRAIHHSI